MITNTRARTRVGTLPALRLSKCRETRLLISRLTDRLLGCQWLRLTPGIFVVAQANIGHGGVVVRECNGIVADHGIFELPPHSQLLLGINGAQLAAFKTR